MTIITPTEAKLARHFTGFSQAKVARMVNIGRTKLALFEVEKYLLDNDSLISLKQFYTSHGYCFDEQNFMTKPAIAPVQPAEPQSQHVIDGYVVSKELSEDEAQEILVELQSVDNEIELLAAKNPKLSFWSGTPEDDCLNEMLKLCAHNYVLIRKLQWYPLENEIPSVRDDSHTIGGLLLELINNHEIGSTL